MKQPKSYIQEKPIIKMGKRIDYKYFPKTKEELQDIILQRIKTEGNEVDLNNIDMFYACPLKENYKPKFK